MKKIDDVQLIDIGNRLRRCRFNKKQNQSEIAELLNTSVNTVSAIENGIHEFSLSKLIKFSEIYEVTTDYILYGKEQALYDDELVNKVLNLHVRERRKLLACINACDAIRL